MRSISWRFAMPALLMSWFAARTSSSARVSWIDFGLLIEAARAPSVMCLTARSMRLCGATSTLRW